MNENDTAQNHDLFATTTFDFTALRASVGALVDHRINSALDGAASQIEEWRDMSARRADDETRAEPDRSRALQRMNAYDHAARIIRAAIPTDPPVVVRQP